MFVFKQLFTFFKALCSIDTQHNNPLPCAECRYAECRILFTIMLSVSMLNVVMLGVIMLNIVMPVVSSPSQTFEGKARNLP